MCDPPLFAGRRVSTGAPKASVVARAVDARPSRGRESRSCRRLNSPSIAFAGWLAATVLAAVPAWPDTPLSAGVFCEEAKGKSAGLLLSTPQRSRVCGAGVGSAALPAPADAGGPDVPPSQSPSLPEVRIGSTIFLSYQDGRTAGADYSRFLIKRGYLDLSAKLTPSLAARITPDVTQDTSGETRLRLKYGYAVASAPRLGWITAPYVEVGMVHTPWIDFEEKVNRYRMQDTLFLERVGIMSSADLGVMAVGLLGGTMPEEYQRSVSGGYPGRFGSFALGVYNGGGYTASEQNTNKAIEGRISIRPLPELAPGLQVSCFGVSGKGNTAVMPEWTTRMAAVTFESRQVNVVAIYLTGSGNSKGDAVDSAGRALQQDGWSGFIEGKLSTRWSLIARHEGFTPDTRRPSITTRRTIVGVAYHLGRGNDVLLDYDEIRYDGTTKPKDSRTQLTLQVKF